MAGALSALVSGGTGFTVTLTASNLNGFSTSIGTAGTSRATTAQAFGGSAPYTYAWTRVSGDTEIFPGSPTAATTKFYAGSAVEDSFSGVFKCVVTDSTAAIVDSSGVTIVLTITSSV